MQNNKVLVDSKKLEIRRIARRIAKEAPTLADLTSAQLDIVARAVIAENLKQELKQEADLARIDYARERAAFLSHSSRSGSEHTRRAYSSAIDALDAFAAFLGVPVLAFKAKEADDFIYSLSGSPATVRRNVAACSSFFTFLERRHESVKNPFRGTKARPRKEARKEVSIPDSEELSAIMEALDPVMRAAVACMAYRGLRVGALPSLSIRGGRYTARSKGQEIRGVMPHEAIDVIRSAGLPLTRPFDGLTAAQIADRFRYAVKRLFDSGIVSARYSVHDLRHYYAIGQYRQTRDIVRLKRLLGHASIQVTEVYLAGLGEEV